MRAYVSLWSCDLLDVGRAVNALQDAVRGFHIDVFDGHDVPELLFGPDFVAALRRRTNTLIDVHLNVIDALYWAGRFAAVGADMITVQVRALEDVDVGIAALRGHGVRVGLGLEIDQPVDAVAPWLAAVDRVLVMGTKTGIKGATLDPATPARVRELRHLVDASRLPVEVVVDGGIRAERMEELAMSGAHGVIPGSLVMNSDDPAQVVRWLADLPGPSEIPA